MHPLARDLPEQEVVDPCVVVDDAVEAVLGRDVDGVDLGLARLPKLLQLLDQFRVGRGAVLLHDGHVDLVHGLEEVLQEAEHGLVLQRDPGRAWKKANSKISEIENSERCQF